MIVKKFEIIPYKINLKQPFINSNVRINNREGFVIGITDELDNTAYGEVSPLPGSSSESLESVGSKLLEFKNEFLEKEIDSELFNSTHEYPSMRFGVSQAIHSIYIMRNGYDPAEMFNPNILVNAVVGMMPQLHALHKIEKLIASGFKIIKIKGGRKNIDDDIELIRIISESFNKSIRYRFDANGCWTIDETKYFLKQISKINIEYVEQPVKSLDELVKLSNNTSIPIAADESIRKEEDVQALLEESNIEYFVLKPSIMGAITEAIDLMKLIEIKKRKVIISSAFESSIGRSALVFLTSQINNDIAHGLSVADSFIKDVAEDLYPIIDAKINFDERYYPPVFMNIEKQKK